MKEAVGAPQSSPIPPFPGVIRFGNFEVDTRAGELRRAGIKLKLSGQPFDVLIALAEKPGQVVTREELHDKLWSQDTSVDFEHGLNKAINKVREALGDNADNPRFIETLPRRGYRFLLPATKSTEPPAVDRPASVDHTPEQPLVASIPAKSWRIALAVLAAGVIVVVLIFAYRFWHHGHGGETEGLRLSRLTDNRRTERVAISPDGRYVVYAAEEGERLGLWIRQALTRSSAVEIVPPDVVGFAGLTFSPDGNYVYFVRGGRGNPVSHSLFVTPVLGGPARLLLSGIDSPVSFSPDGHQIVYTRRTADENALELRIADAEGSDGRLLAILHDAVAFHQAGPAWSPDGRTIAVSVMLSGRSQQWDLEAVSVADGTVHEIHSSPYKIGRPLWLPSGDGLLAALDDQNNHGQLYLIPFPSGKPRRLTNDLADYDDDRIDLTRDGKTAAIVAWDESSDVWQVPAADLARAQQTESSGVALTTIAARSDGKILVTDLANQLWIMNPNGSQRTPFTDFHPAAYPLVCGQFVMFLQSTIQGDSRGLMRADADGTNIRKLVGEHVGSAACSADGKFVYYDTEDSPQKIRKISVEGGDPVDVLMIPGDQIESQFTLSLDGTRLVYLYRESGDAAEVKLALMPADGGPPVRVLRMRGEPSKLHWSPDGKTLQYTICIFCAGSASNIWEQPLEGGEPKELTNFSSGKIFDFTWSADRKLLLLLRGDLNGDVVLLSNFR